MNPITLKRKIKQFLRTIKDNGGERQKAKDYFDEFLRWLEKNNEKAL